MTGMATPGSAGLMKVRGGRFMRPACQPAPFEPKGLRKTTPFLNQTQLLKSAILRANQGQKRRFQVKAMLNFDDLIGNFRTRGCSAIGQRSKLG